MDGNKKDCTGLVQYEDAERAENRFISNSSYMQEAFYSEDQEYLYLSLPEDEGEGYLLIGTS